MITSTATPGTRRRRSRRESARWNRFSWEKNVTTHDAIDTLVAAFENDLGPMHGAKVIAKAWVDPDYRKRLETDGTSAIAELGYRGLQTEHVKAVFNTPTDHNVLGLYVVLLLPVDLARHPAGLV